MKSYLHVCWFCLEFFMLDVSNVLAAAGKLKKGESVQNIRLCDISRDESQPRTVFDDQSLLELATLKPFWGFRPRHIERNFIRQYTQIFSDDVFKFSIINPCFNKLSYFIEA